MTNVATGKTRMVVAPLTTRARMRAISIMGVSWCATTVATTMSVKITTTLQSVRRGAAHSENRRMLGPAAGAMWSTKATKVIEMKYATA